MLDFLSALVMKRAMTLDGIVIVLNGSSMVKRVIPVLEGKDINTIHVFTDNDAAGEQAHQKIRELYPSEKILKHTFYDSFKDVNEYVVNKFKP
jgi:5S rRNA maturation endonuclease (ribonuclease M5)